MSKIRQQRTADQIQRILSQLFMRGLSDPRLQGVTVTDVAIDRELQYADIYVHALGDEDRQAEVMSAIEGASGFLRHELAQRVRLRTVPVLRFNWDPSLAFADQVNELLDSLRIPPDSDAEQEE